jgi:exosortase/archaeosortase family protein
VSNREYKSLAGQAAALVAKGTATPSGKRFWAALTDADVVFAYCVSVFLAAIVGKWVGAFDAPVSVAVRLFDIADINAGEALAMCAMASIAFGARRTLSLTTTDLLVIVAAALFFLPPEPQNLPFIGATLAGAYFWRVRRNIPALLSLGQLWIAISTHAAWGQLAFRIMSAPILRLETLAIARLGQDLGLGLAVNGAELATPSGWSVYILAPCSSFHNLSLAALVWLSLLKLGREPIRQSAWFALFTGGVLIVLLNASRILLMTLSEAQYQYWHDGLGRSLFICLTFAAIAIPTLLSMRGMRQPRAFATRR